MAAGSYSVTMTDANSCTATTSIAITVQPPTSVSIAASANPVNAGTPVTFTATPVNGGATQSYQWKVNGTNVGAHNSTYSYTPVNGDVVTCVMTTGDGCIANSNAVTMTVSGVGNTILQNITVGNAQSPCYDAIQSIIVAGSGTTFIVQDGGSVIMVAGHNIQYLTGTHIMHGGEMHGYITTNGQYCGAKSVSMVPFTEGDPGNRPAYNKPFFRVYPNPTTGTFTLELTGIQSEPVDVEIYGMRGEKVLSEVTAGSGKHEFSLSEKPAGIYFIKVVAGEHLETFKLVKTR